MADKKDNTPSKGSKFPELTTSDSAEKPLSDEKPSEEIVEIDTSHLSIEDTTEKTSHPLSDDEEKEAPAINTSYLTLEDSDNSPPADTPTAASDQDNPDKTEEPAADNLVTPPAATEKDPGEHQLHIKNPLAEKAGENSDSADAKDDADQVMLTSGISDAEFEKEMEGPSGSKNDENADEDPENPIKSILETVKKPEKIVRNAWSNSSARRYLIDNVESYRVKDEDQNMEQVIENVYGGTVERKFAPGKFLKENILFSLLLLLFLFLVGWKVAGIMFPDFMPGINDQIIATVKKTTSGKKVEEAEKKKPVVTNYESKQKIDEVLSHCLIEPDARIAFALAFTKTGYEFTDRPLTFSYDEIHDSIGIWKDMNIEFYTRDAIYRFRELSRLAAPVLLAAKKSVSDYRESLINLNNEARQLDKKIRNIKTRGGNQSTYTINERIPLRNKLEQIKARLKEEPGLTRFDQLLNKIALVEDVLAGRVKPTRIEPDELTEKDPTWLLSTSETAATEIDTPIIGKVLPGIAIPVDKLKKVFPKLTAFHLSELENALNDLLKLSSLIVYLPENKLIPYKLELSGLSRRLNETMEKQLPVWMSYDRCLTRERIEVKSDLE